MKFFHTADIHFGVENYGKVDPTTGIHTRLLDFAKNLECVVDQAIQEQVDFFLFCGDAYKTAQPTPTQQKLLAQILLKLHAAHIPVVIVVGNHDHPLSFGKAHALDVFAYLPLDGFYVFSKPDLVVLPTKSGPVQIVGIPWPTRNHVITSALHRFKSNNEIAAYIAEKVGEIIGAFAQQLDETIPAVLAAHLSVSTGVFSGSEKCAVYGTDPVFLPSQLALPQFDYVALGHLHNHQNLNASGKPPIIYAGSLERIDFGERRDSKGFCRVIIDKEQKINSYEFIPLKTRPMVQIEVFIDAGLDHTQQVLETLQRYDINDAIIKILYHVPDGKNDTVDLMVIQDACSKAHHVVGIFPVYKPINKERRAALKIDMDLATLLSRYFETKELSKARKDILIEKAFMLKQQLEQQEQEL